MPQQQYNQSLNILDIFSERIYILFNLKYTATIMNPYTWGSQSRYGVGEGGYGVTTPQTDDKNGINYLY